MLLRRVLTVAVLLPMFTAGLFLLPGAWWAVALLPLLLVGGWEWGTLSGFGSTGRLAFCGVLLLSALSVSYGGTWLSAAEPLIYGASAVFWLAVVPLWLGRAWRPRAPVLLAATGWILLVPTWLALVKLQTQPWILLAVLGVVWVADSAAYFSGHLWGRHKLAPAVSPGKTWEGVAGAAVAVAVYHAVVWNFGFGTHSHGLGLAATILVFTLFPLSIMGDLFESWMKRQAGVKDSGSLLPGHGGVLDRIDALTSTLPPAALAVEWILHRG